VSRRGQVPGSVEAYRGKFFSLCFLSIFSLRLSSACLSCPPKTSVDLVSLLSTLLSFISTVSLLQPNGTGFTGGGTSTDADADNSTASGTTKPPTYVPFSAALPQLTLSLSPSLLLAGLGALAYLF
jgi:hypothetical protein